MKKQNSILVTGVLIVGHFVALEIARRAAVAIVDAGLDAAQKYKVGEKIKTAGSAVAARAKQA